MDRKRSQSMMVMAILLCVASATLAQSGLTLTAEGPDTNPFRNHRYFVSIRSDMAGSDARHEKVDEWLRAEGRARGIQRLEDLPRLTPESSHCSSADRSDCYLVYSFFHAFDAGTAWKVPPPPFLVQQEPPASCDTGAITPKGQMPCRRILSYQYEEDMKYRY